MLPGGLSVSATHRQRQLLLRPDDIDDILTGLSPTMVRALGVAASCCPITLISWFDLDPLENTARTYARAHEFRHRSTSQL